MNSNIIGNNEPESLPNQCTHQASLQFTSITSVERNCNMFLDILVHSDARIIEQMQLIFFFIRSKHLQKPAKTHSKPKIL